MTQLVVDELRFRVPVTFGHNFTFYLKWDGELETPITITPERFLELNWLGTTSYLRFDVNRDISDQVWLTSNINDVVSSTQTPFYQDHILPDNSQAVNKTNGLFCNIRGNRVYYKPNELNTSEITLSGGLPGQIQEVEFILTNLSFYSLTVWNLYTSFQGNHPEQILGKDNILTDNPIYHRIAGNNEHSLDYHSILNSSSRERRFPRSRNTSYPRLGSVRNDTPDINNLNITDNLTITEDWGVEFERLVTETETTFSDTLTATDFFELEFFRPEPPEDTTGDKTIKIVWPQECANGLHFTYEDISVVSDDSVSYYGIPETQKTSRYVVLTVYYLTKNIVTTGNPIMNIYFYKIEERTGNILISKNLTSTDDSTLHKVQEIVEFPL